MAHSPKAVIMGIDGATWRLVAPWIEQGELPNLGRLKSQGASGNLLSTIPPVTAPAWSSMITGRNPGQHGLFDFAGHRSDEYGVEYLVGAQRRCPTIWKILSDRGYRVGVINVPMTYPPEELSGYMISGMDTPDESSPFIAPESLRQEIQDELGGLHLDIHHLGYMTSDSKRLAVIDELLSIEEERVRLIAHLAEKHPCDAVMFVINAVDQIQHHFWHYMDPEHPRFDAQGKKQFGDAILKVYRRIDALLGEVMEIFGTEPLYMVVSDHGFQPSSDLFLCLNKALAQGGFLTFKESFSPAAYALGKVSDTLRQTLSPKAKQKISSLLPWARAKVEASGVASHIDWEKTRAYAFEAAVTSPNVWINLKGKRPNGTVSAAEYLPLIEEIRDYLLSLTVPGSDTPLIPRIWHKEEIYSGAALDEAPDLVLDWWQGKGFTPRPSVVNGRLAEYPVVERVNTPLEGGKEWGGTHSENGVVILSGPRVTAGQKLEGAKITDIAPTLFAALGEPPLTEFDGNALIDGAPQTNGKSVVEGTIPPQPESSAENEVAISEEDREKIRQRLKMLGYLD
ncbi:MAG: hypothetical protein C0621_02270 [Desulfuromonas sp.]|nr:MAG: hypothetical protein C0621_02270 [Desulfuromonas sp.]